VICGVQKRAFRLCFPRSDDVFIVFLWVTVVCAQRGCNLCSIQSYCNQTSLQKVIDSLVILE
jgi:hypothetical protein